MAASDHLGEQLRMFMTAPEIQGYLNESIDRRGGESMKGLWKRKWRQSDHIFEHYEDEDDEGHMAGIGPSLRQSIEQEGYHDKGEAVHVIHNRSEGTRSVTDFHHRLAVLGTLHPQHYLPVVHHKSYWDDD